MSLLVSVKQKTVSTCFFKKVAVQGTVIRNWVDHGRVTGAHGFSDRVDRRRVLECVCTGIISYSARGKLVLFIFCSLANKPVKSAIMEDTLFSLFCFGQHVSAIYSGVNR